MASPSLCEARIRPDSALEADSACPGANSGLPEVSLGRDRQESAGGATKAYEIRRIRRIRSVRRPGRRNLPATSALGRSLGRAVLGACGRLREPETRQNPAQRLGAALDGAASPPNSGFSPLF